MFGQETRQQFLWKCRSATDESGRNPEFDTDTGRAWEVVQNSRSWPWTMWAAERNGWLPDFILENTLDDEFQSSSAYNLQLDIGKLFYFSDSDSEITLHIQNFLAIRQANIYNSWPYNCSRFRRRPVASWRSNSCALTLPRWLAWPSLPSHLCSHLKNQYIVANMKGK